MPERNGGNRMICSINNGQHWFVGQSDNGDYILIDGYGFILNPDQMEAIGKSISKFAKKHTKQILDYNANLSEQMDMEMRKCYSIPHHKSKKPGFLYLVKCGDKYKIGMTNNVSRRMRQLDTRPYNLSLIKSVKVDDMPSKERVAHKKFAEFKEIGEWYSFTPAQVQEVLDYFAEVAC